MASQGNRRCRAPSYL